MAATPIQLGMAKGVLGHRLAGVLSEFAHVLGTEFPINAILDHLVGQIVRVLPVDSAGVSLIASGVNPRLVVASDDFASELERLQSSLGEGPSVEVVQSGKAIFAPDLRTDERFPRFSPRASAEGLAAVFSFPLNHYREPIGALDLYRSTPGPMHSTEMEAAKTLADVAAAYLINARVRDELRETAEMATRVALHDPLTGLPNRLLLLETLEHAIRRARRSKKLVAVLFADLDRFKWINDTYGHNVGDQLLIAVAGRLTQLLRLSDTVARLAGDEFVIVCEDLDDASQVEQIVARVQLALGQPFRLGRAEVHVTASVGIAFAGQGEGPGLGEQTIDDADAAMYTAKRIGGGHATLQPQIVSHSDCGGGLARDLHAALDRNELFVEYQPVVSTGDEQIVGYEALLRGQHPIRGLVGPAVIIPLGEHSGLVNAIGRWVLETACIDLRKWLASRGDGTPVGVSVNVSTRQLMTSDFVSTVADVLHSADTDPSLVTLEVTESVLATDIEQAFEVLERSKLLGVRIALDDFGTGYSSLRYLSRFPADIVKIDGVFTAELVSDLATRQIVEAVIGLAHGLGMYVVAEGIETIEQRDLLLALRCDAWQGFHFAHPMPISVIDATLALGGPSD